MIIFAMPYSDPRITLHPASPRDDQSGPDPVPEVERREAPLVVVPTAHTIEDGIELGIREVNERQGPITLQLKGIELSIEPQDSFQSIFARYKELEFNAHAATYERDFIQRNWAMYSVAAETLRREALCYADPLRMLDVGCGTGFAFRETFSGRQSGRYFGIDPAENMLRGLERVAKENPAIEIVARQAKAGILLIDSVQDEIVSALGGKPQLVCWLAAMHVVNKHEHLGPQISATADLLDEHGRVIIGNYFHNSAADFEAFRERYMRSMIHQPTPPSQLFNPSQMEAILRVNWLEVVSCQEMVCTDGLRAYVMVAKRK